MINHRHSVSGGRRTLLNAAVAAALMRWSTGSRAREKASLARIDDLRELALRVKRSRAPLLLFFSTPGCPYCREARLGYLVPRTQELATTLIIREVEVTAARSLIGLDGNATSEAELARRFEVKMVPHVVLVDEALRPLGEPLIGIDSSGFYEGRLSAAIEAAQRKLKLA